jgi:hypothetical protein
MDDKTTLACRQARKRFAALAHGSNSQSSVAAFDKMSVTERAATERHLQTCAGCEREFKLYRLGRATLDLAASPEVIEPDKDFFVALRARIERGPAAIQQPADTASESWAAVFMLTARQLIPAMAMLLLLIIGLTMFSDGGSANGREIAVGSGQYVRMNDLYFDPEPTPVDVLEVLVAVEEKENGR